MNTTNLEFSDDIDSKIQKPVNVDRKIYSCDSGTHKNDAEINTVHDSYEKYYGLFIKRKKKILLQFVMCVLTRKI